MVYKIETGVSIPAERRSMGAPRKYPLTSLKVGQSFFVPKKTSGQLGGCIRLVVQANKRLKFTARTMGGGVRIWRVK